MVIAKRDKKFVIKLVAIKVIIVSVFLLLILPVFPVEIPIVCITEPCINPIELKSGIDLISEHFEEEPQACIQIFDPVCGVDGITYSNQCFADVAGVEIQFEGQCF